MFYGAASGGARKALQLLQEPNVMLSYATKNNKPWFGIETLFVDCGGYSFMMNKGEYGPLGDYVEYLRRWQPDYYALRDYPCEPDVLDEHNAHVRQHQLKTTDAHVEMLDAVGDLDGQAVAVVQGWDVEDYLFHIDHLREHGVPLETVAIGSVCRRNAEQDIERVIRAVREELPDAHLHAFGVKTSVFKHTSARQLLDSADSLAYSYASMKEHGRGDWRSQALEYLKMRQRLLDDDTQVRPEKQLSAFEGLEP